MLPDTLGPLEEIARNLDNHNKRLEALERQRSGSNRLIDSLTLTGSVASVAFASIPNIYDHLLLLYYIRGSAAVTVDQFNMRFNADSGNNYDYLRVAIFQPSALGTAEGLGVSFIQLPGFPCASAPANVFGEGRIRIIHYANTTNQKTSQTVAATKFGILTTRMRHGVTGGYWRSNNAITSITLFPFTGGNNFVAGSRFDLYGVQGGS